ncbi:MAG: NTP transferase domain-containing protein [Candidatus Lokiarchaeota archaeon]|nr:NTP transferase domain-containing protein [Candidatus Lokiarchaeota archaeon]
MKALVLTAGKGRRLMPLTSNRSKSMLMIAGHPVLQYIIESLKENNIHELVVVVGHGREEIIDYFEMGADHDISIRYVIQHEQKGVEHAILSAYNDLENEEEFLLVNGDVLVEPDMVTRTLNNHRTMNSDVTMLVTLVSNPQQFGTVKIGRNGIVERLVEKGGSDRYVSNYAVAGVSVFNIEILELLEKYKTMEHAIENMIESKKTVAAAVWEKEWAEFTWPWDILKANQIVLDRQLRGYGSFIAESAEIHKNVVLEGPVFIDEGSIIRPGTTIRGPVHIGKRVYVGNNSLVREYTSLSDGVHIGYSVELRNSMVFERVNIGRMTYLADSIVGSDTCIEAGVQLWNWRPSGAPLFLENGEEKIRVPLTKMGAMIGDQVVIGVNTSIYPATRIGEGTIIDPSCVIDKDIPPRSKVSVTQTMIVEPLDNEENLV